MASEKEFEYEVLEIADRLNSIKGFRKDFKEMESLIGKGKIIIDTSDTKETVTRQLKDKEEKNKSLNYKFNQLEIRKEGLLKELKREQKVSKLKIKDLNGKIQRIQSFNVERRDLTSKLEATKEDLEATKEDLEATKDKLEATKEDLEATKLDLRKSKRDVVASSDKARKLREDDIKKKREIQRLQNDINEYEKEYNDLKNKYNAQKNILENRKVLLGRETRKLRSDLRTEKEKALKSSKSIKELKQKIEKCEKELKTKEEELAEALKKSNANDLEASNNKKRAVELEGKRLKALAEIEDLKEQLANALKKVNVFEKVARESRRGYEDAKRREATLRDSLFRERKIRDEKITELEGTIADLEGENLNQRLSATQLRKEGQFKSKKITQLKQEARQLSEKLEGTIADLKGENLSQRLSATRLRKEGQFKSKKIMQLKQKARQLSEKLDELKDKLKEKREEIMDFESLKKELKEAKEDYIDLEEQCKQTVEKYENRRVIEGKEMKSLRRQLADEKNKHRELKRLHETLKESHSELEQRYKELVDSCEEGKVVEELHDRIEKMQNEHATRLEEIRDGKLDTDERQLLQLQTQYNAVKTRVDAQERVLELVEYRKIQEIGDKMKKAKTMEEIEPLEKELKAALGRVQQIVGEKEQLMKDAKKRILRDAMRIRNNSIRSGTWKTVIKALFFVLILSMNLIMTQNLAAGRRQELEDYVSGTSNNANLFRMMLNAKNINPDNAINTMLENDGTPQQLVNDMLNGKYNTKKDDEKKDVVEEISDDEVRSKVRNTINNMVNKNQVQSWLSRNPTYNEDDFITKVVNILKRKNVDVNTKGAIRDAIVEIINTDVPPEIGEVDVVPKKIRY